jgi:cytochrome b
MPSCSSKRGGSHGQQNFDLEADMTQFGETSAPASESDSSGRLMVDAPVRMFHALFAVCFFGAWLTSEWDRWRCLHVVLGYSMAGLLLFRVVYGLFGPPQARLRLLLGRLKGLLGMASFIKTGEPRLEGNTNRVSLLGTLQNISMAATILAVIVLMAVTGMSGYLAWNDAPKWVEELHEACGEALITLGIVHIALVLGFSLLRKRNLALTMLTGKIAGPGPSLVQNNRAWLALMMLITVCAFSAYEFQQMPGKFSADHASAWMHKEGGKHEYAARKGKQEKHYLKREHKRRED